MAKIPRIWQLISQAYGTLCGRQQPGHAEPRALESQLTVYFPYMSQAFLLFLCMLLDSRRQGLEAMNGELDSFEVNSAHSGCG